MEKGKKMEGAEWKGEKQTEADVNYGCNLRFPRGKGRQRETSSHAYQITHLPHFLIMVHEQTRTQSGLFVCVHARLCVTQGVRALTYSSMSSCVVLSDILKTTYDVCVCVCLKLC